MPIFRATVWFLHELDDWCNLSRNVVQDEAESEYMFKAQIMDERTNNGANDNEVWFGPVSKKEILKDYSISEAWAVSSKVRASYS